jgi:hypothetical protein
LKALDKGYKFSSKFILIKGLHTKLWDPKVAKVPTLAISGLLFRSPRTMPFGCGLVERHTIYYKGEGGGFPQVRAAVSVMNPCLFVVSGFVVVRVSE